MLPSPGRRNRLPALFVILGGLVLLVTVMLPWYSWSSPHGFAKDVRGLSVLEGTILGLCGALLVVAGVQMVLASGRQPRSPILPIGLGLLASALAIYLISHREDTLERGIRQAIERDMGKEATAAELDRANADLQRVGLLFSLGPGLYLALAGGLVSMAGGASAAGRRDAGTWSGIGTDGWRGRRDIRRRSRRSFPSPGLSRDPSRWGVR